MNNISTVWKELQTKLKPGMQIQAWSQQKGFLSTRFEILHVEPSFITIKSNGTTMPRSISKGDMARVYSEWGNYCSGMKSRAQMRDISQNTTYIFGILKWNEKPRPMRELLIRPS